MRALSLAGALICAAYTALAQTARGVVRDSTTDVPLPGAVVIALDSAGGTTARTLTDSSGRFSLVIARATRLRVLRIGYVFREASIDRVRDVVVDFAMIRTPRTLTTVRVAERETCPSDEGRESGAAAWQLWEQARAGLLSAVVANAANPMNATTLVYDRRIAAFDDLVRRQSIDKRTGMAVRPFTSAGATRFATLGYLDEDSTGRTFHGPDAEVLLDPSFAETHCFGRRVADARHRGQIGVTFAPSPNRDTLVEVSGVIWFDSTGSALRSLEFRYTALEPSAMRAEAGGSIEFRTMRNGATFVERWNLRVPVMMPVVGASVQRGFTPGKSRRMTNTTVRVAELQENGGLVTEASWRDGTTWAMSLAGLTGAVRESGVDSPVPGAVVTIDGVAGAVATDRDGEFMLAPLVPGRYTLVATDTSLERFASPRRTTRVVDVTPNELSRVSLRVESFVDVVRRVCKDRRSSEAARVIVGRITPEGGVPSARPHLRATWAKPSADSGFAEATVDERGGFVVCAADPGVDVRLRASVGRLESDTTIDAGFTLITSVDWKPTLRAPVAGPDARVVRGVVTDSGLRPVARATVSVAGLQSVVTDDSGWFRLRLPNRGEAVLELRRVAFAPTRFGLPAGGDTSISITLLQSIQQLESMNVKDAAPSSANLRGFDERLRRRARGITFGTFITAEQIERRSPAKVTQLFFDVPGIKMLKVHPLFERYAIFGMSRTMAGGPSACPATVYLDGIRLLEGGDIIKLKDPETGKPVREAGVAIDDLVSPSQIAGIEVYRSATDAPAQYQVLNGTCVVVLIWTK